MVAEQLDLSLDRYEVAAHPSASFLAKFTPIPRSLLIPKGESMLRLNRIIFVFANRARASLTLLKELIAEELAMLLLRLLHLSTLLILAFNHLLAYHNKQHTDIRTIEYHGLSEFASDHRRLNLRNLSLSRRVNSLEGYQFSLSQHIQILPVTVAAEALREFWTEVMVAVVAKWQSNDHFLDARFGGLEILFENGNEDVSFDWTAILFFASYMKDKVGNGGGWAGFFQGTMTDLATQAMIRVTLRYVGQVS